MVPRVMRQRRGPRKRTERPTASPQIDAELLLRWALANVVIGNRDAHARNVSILHHEDGTRRLAPVYDREVASDVLTRVRQGVDDALHTATGEAGPHDILPRIRETVHAQHALLAAHASARARARRGSAGAREPSAYSAGSPEDLAASKTSRIS